MKERTKNILGAILIYALFHAVVYLIELKQESADKKFSQQLKSQFVAHNNRISGADIQIGEDWDQVAVIMGQSAEGEENRITAAYKKCGFSREPAFYDAWLKRHVPDPMFAMVFMNKGQIVEGRFVYLQDSPDWHQECFDRDKVTIIRDGKRIIFQEAVQ